jgi:ubiquitin-protein ligase E3 C
MVFDLEFGLFRRTPEGLLYPNPDSVIIHGVEHLRLFEFVGRILGKVRTDGRTTT